MGTLMFCVQYFHVYETQAGFCITDDTLILADYCLCCDLFDWGKTGTYHRHLFVCGGVLYPFVGTYNYVPTFSYKSADCMTLCEVAGWGRTGRISRECAICRVTKRVTIIYKRTPSIIP